MPKNSPNSIFVPDFAGAPWSLSNQSLSTPTGQESQSTKQEIPATTSQRPTGLAEHAFAMDEDYDRRGDKTR